MANSAPTTTLVRSNFNSRLDRLPITIYHKRWLLILGAAYLVESFDNTVFAYVAPSIRESWDLSLGQIGVITSAVFVGMIIGAVVGGRWSDRFGRRPVIILGSIFYSLMSLVSAIAPNYEILAISRVLTGVGVQATTGVLMVYLSEMFPKHVRGRSFTVLTFIGFSATPIAAFTALAIAPTGIEAWRWVFAMGAAGLIIAVIAAIWLPETIRWLSTEGKAEQAERITAKLEKSVLAKGGTLTEPAPEMPGVPQGSFRELFQPEYFKRLIVMGTSFFLFLFALFGFLSWVPTILTDRGMTQTEALNFVSILSLFSMVGAAALFPLADKLERKTLLLLGGLLGSAGLIVFAFADSISISLAAGITVQFAMAAMSVVFYTYLPEVFPTNVRGVGAGVVNGFGRIAGMVSGVAVAGVYSAFGFQPLYTLLAVVLVLAALLVWMLGPRTTNRSLESISSAN